MRLTRLGTQGCGSSHNIIRCSFAFGNARGDSGVTSRAGENTRICHVSTASKYETYAESCASVKRLLAGASVELGRRAPVANRANAWPS